MIFLIDDFLIDDFSIDDFLIDDFLIDSVIKIDGKAMEILIVL